MARCFARVGLHDRALELIDAAEVGGFFCYPFFASDPWLDVLRGDPRLLVTLRRAESRMHDAARAFAEHPGSRILAVGVKR
jgi:hypothetical protein